MNSKFLTKGLKYLALTLATVFVASGPSFAADVCLVAQEFPKTMPDTVSVPMWGFGEGTWDGLTCDFSLTVASVPGPVIAVAAGDTTLTIHLRNDLPTPLTPGTELRGVSVVIPALGRPTVDGGDTVERSGVRAQSLVQSTPNNATTVSVYEWSNVRPGTYLYHSGTHMAVQMQMGLYGAVKQDYAAGMAPAGQAYDNTGCPVLDSTCNSYDNEVVLLYSEVDPVLHQTVADGNYGATGYATSTMEYQPRYFLVNGQAYPSPPIVGLSASQKVLVRFLDAGLRTHIPAIQNNMFSIIAQDGNLLPNALEQASVRLGAGQTKDAFLTLGATVDDTLVIYDRMLDLTNAGQPDGGLIVALTVGAGSSSGPVAADDGPYAATEETLLTVATGAGVLANDTGAAGALLVRDAENGALALAYDGSFTYTGDADFTGSDSFTYRADGGGSVATVRIDVGNTNDTPVALDDGPFTVVDGNSITVYPLGNDYDADGDDLTVLSSAGGFLNPDGSITYTASTPGLDSFTYDISDDGVIVDATATVTIDVLATTGPNLSVVDPTGVAISAAGFRWTLEEDVGYFPTPGTREIDSLSLSFHKSAMPVVASGEATGASAALPALDPLKHYYVSVLPTDGYALGGGPIAPGQMNVEVFVQPQPIPTAQITVFAFEDNQPVNGSPDLPEEGGLEGFQVILEDAAGKYGMAGGHSTMDVYGNPLGTTYCSATDILTTVTTDPCYGGMEGDAKELGDGFIHTNEFGRVTIKNLPPGKYGVQVIPPAGETGWQQTSTIEGTKVIDAWVKANEPAFFAEFGPPGFHAFVGFVKETTAALGGGATVSGSVVNMHAARPPAVGFWPGQPFSATTPWVGLNDLSVGDGVMIWAERTDEGAFSIEGVPDGNYQLVVFDDYLDIIIAFHGVTIQGGQCLQPDLTYGSCNFGSIPVFTWFTRIENRVFEDTNADGFWQDGEPNFAAARNALLEQATLIRWRDGTVNQSFPTDLEGFVPYDQVFPFFSWQVLEVDFARYKATGATIIVDAGGDPGDGTVPWSFGGILNPQPQPDNSGAPYRVEASDNVGTVLLQGFQGFIGHTSVIQWGKRAWEEGENGGIAGIVYYAITRAENDPRLAAAEEWEPGIANVTVRLYDKTGTLLLNETETDSWDASPPEGCVWDGAPYEVDDGTGTMVPLDCFDGLRNYNQVRSGVFDGGFAFEEICTGGLANCTAEDDPDWLAIPAGDYVVEVVVPPGYKLLKEEDVNVVFGDEYDPANASGMQLDVLLSYLDQYYPWASGPGVLASACVGAPHTVPDELTLFAGEEAPWHGQSRPLCDRKAVRLQDKSNGVAEFFLFTDAPISAHAVGFVQNDLANEFDPNSPIFGEKFAPSWMPVSIRDWSGKEISRVYSDEWGRFNFLAPSTFTANIGAPSGMAPNMLIACMNDSGPIPDPANVGQFITDPQHKPQYSQYCYTFQYMPGSTTYLDTPVLPVAAFADQPLDCALPEGTPRIYSVSNGAAGPYVPAGGGTLTITSMGSVNVTNPLYTGVLDTESELVSRDFGFGGTEGTVTLGGLPLAVTWGEPILATVPPGMSTGQLVVTRGDNGLSTIVGVTVHVDGTVPTHVTAGGSIQAAIDAATDGDVIFVEPGNYDEMVILWRNIDLQGYGEGSTIINAANRPTEKLQAWLDKIDALVAANEIDVLDGQEVAPPGPVEVEPVLFLTEQGAGIFVVTKLKNNGKPKVGGLIDGFTVTGSMLGGGIVVNGNTKNFQISNNYVRNNAGFFNGGIRVGHPELIGETDGLHYTDANNFGIKIHHNAVSENGGLGGAGGGLSICTGAEQYSVTQNWICGNFTTGDGGGIGHLGLSDKGVIESNTILFNQSFNQSTFPSGGGISIAGQAPLCPATLAGCPADDPEQNLTPGSGRVSVLGNLIHSNQAGAGNGGGIATRQVNGQDVEAKPNARGQWNRIDLENNMIVNNVAGVAGGGISLQDTARIFIRHNTIANNDSTATGGNAFTLGNPNNSVAQPAGIVSHKHSDALTALFTGAPATYKRFSDPFVLENNIIWHNRSFYVDITFGADPRDYAATLVPNIPADQAVYDDLGVLGTVVPESMSPMTSILTDTTGYDPSNFSADPAFAAEYSNQNDSAGIIIGEPTTGIDVAIAFDEGGNYIDLRYSPLTLAGNYHVDSGSPAVDAAASSDLDIDFDIDPRPQGAGSDIGADELSGGAPPAAATGGNGNGNGNNE